MYNNPRLNVQNIKGSVKVIFSPIDFYYKTADDLITNILYNVKIVPKVTYIKDEKSDLIAITESPAKAKQFKHIGTDNRTVESEQVGEDYAYVQIIATITRGSFIEYVSYEAVDIYGESFEEEKYYIYVTDEGNYRSIDIGKNGVIYFITKDNDENNIFNDYDLKEKSEFKTTITDDNSNKYDVVCRLWKPVDEYIRIFCKLNTYITSQNIKLNSASLRYNNLKIIIISQMNYFMRLNQIGTEIPFIYSDKQTIEIEKEKNYYEIKLKALEYNNEQLILLNVEQDYGGGLNNMLLNSCNLKGKNLICQISKEKIEQMLGYSGQEFEIIYLDNNRGLLSDLDNVFNIKINYNSILKECLYRNNKIIGK